MHRHMKEIITYVPEALLADLFEIIVYVRYHVSVRKINVYVFLYQPKIIKLSA